MSQRLPRQVVRVLNPEGADGPTVYDVMCSGYTSDRACIEAGEDEAERQTHLHMLVLSGEPTGTAETLADTVEAVGLTTYPFSRRWLVKGEAWLRRQRLDVASWNIKVYSIRTERGRMLRQRHGNKPQHRLGRQLAAMRRVEPSMRGTGIQRWPRTS